MDQPPALGSMVMEGFPPLRQSKYTPEVEKLIKQYVARYNNPLGLDLTCTVGLAYSSYVLPEVKSVERLFAMTLFNAIAFLVDDIFFDDAEASQDLVAEYGIDPNANESPETIQAYLSHLSALFGQEKPLSSTATVMDTMMWELGRDILAQSNPEWFALFVDCINEHYRITVSSHADIVEGHRACFQSLEAYTAMRLANGGGKFIELLVEFSNDSYIPSALRSDPYLQAVIVPTAIYIAFVNDIYSYHKESSQEGNPRNLISMLMNAEGKSFVEASHKAVGLVNKYAKEIMDMSAEAHNTPLEGHAKEIVALLAGNLWYNAMAMRYRHPESVFPELRDVTSNWKVVPEPATLVA